MIFNHIQPAHIRLIFNSLHYIFQKYSQGLHEYREYPSNNAAGISVEFL